MLFNTPPFWSPLKGDLPGVFLGVIFYWGGPHSKGGKLPAFADRWLSVSLCIVPNAIAH